MGKINILDKSIYNRIAAGEVVEKPASVVKELVENSIDGGATSITIDIKNGGISRIRVSDNGCGIEKDDFVPAFMPHATSKIRNVNDLDKIGTLGFRGEALASISSVSKVTLTSKVGLSDEAYTMHVEGGEIGEITPIGATSGTTVVVEDLFFNVPARAKFLRKARQEESEITNYVSRLILANPNIAIKYIADNKQIYQSHGNGLYEAIYNIYGKSVIDNVIEFEHSEDDYYFKGYLGLPTFSKPNRTYQTLVINGRYVINQSVSTAIYKAYENYIMKSTFPFFVIHLTIPLDRVDVNVHPNKLDVKFEEYNKVFNMVYTSVANKLAETTIIKHIEDKQSTFEEIEEDNSPIVHNLRRVDRNEGMSYREDPTPHINDDIKEVRLNHSPLFRENLESIKGFLSGNEKQEFAVADNDFAVKLAERMTQQQMDILPKASEQTSLRLDIDNFKIIGTLFNTYIMIEEDEELYLIDQHAGHERILYDKFMSQLEASQINVQPLLIPYILNVNNQEFEYILTNMELLNNMGWELEEFGKNSFKVNTVPVLLKEISFNSFFNEILSNLNTKLITSNNTVLKDYIAKSACKAAVKANDILSEMEIKILLTKLSQENQVLLCPHGRPIILKITKKDIEKWFKRIV